MKKYLISVAITATLSSTQVIADNIFEGPEYDFHKSELIVPCIKVYDPDGEFDGKYYNAILEQRGGSGNFKLEDVEEVEEEICIGLIDDTLEDVDEFEDNESEEDEDTEDDEDLDEEDSEDDESEDDI